MTSAQKLAWIKKTHFLTPDGDVGYANPNTLWLIARVEKLEYKLKKCKQGKNGKNSKAAVLLREMGIE